MLNLYENKIKPFFKGYFEENPDARVNGKCRSVHFDDNFRFNKAYEEAKKKPTPINEVIRYVNELLNGIGVAPVSNPIMHPEKICYSKIKEEYHLNDIRDLIWLKFTTDGFVGVVAQGNDINFQIPASADDYNKKVGRQWQFNTSGIIVHSLGKQWEQSFVLVFPLRSNNMNYSRHYIETAIGNYLIDKGVPILDFYSHNY